MSVHAPPLSRAATPADAGTLAQFRAAMFLDMHAQPEVGWEACWTTYFQTALADGRYFAVLAEVGGGPVACAGLMVQPVVPTPSDASGLRAHVQGVYTAPEHRGRGLAEQLTRVVLQEARQRGLKSVNLNASVLGRGVYERLGFTEAAAPEMRLKLDAVTP